MSENNKILLGKNLPIHPSGVQEQPIESKKNHQNIMGTQETILNKRMDILLQYLQGLP